MGLEPEGDWGGAVGPDTSTIENRGAHRSITQPVGEAAVQDNSKKVVSGKRALLTGTFS